MKNERPPGETRTAAAAAIAYEFAGYRLEPTRRALTRADGTAVHLVGKPFDTLVYLVAHAGELIDRDELLNAVWPKRVVEDNNLNQAIATIRRAIGERHIVTVAGRGYQFVARVDRFPPPATPGSVAGGSVERPPPQASGVRRPRSPWPAFFAALAAGAIGLALLAVGPIEAPRSPVLSSSVTASPLTTYPGEELTPAISPDGTRVAFSWRAPQGRRAIYVTQMGAGEPVRLSDGDGGQDLHPAWSPDGERIAFVRQYDQRRSDIMVMPGIGGAAGKVFSAQTWPISVEGSPLLAWSPDGRFLVFPTLRAGQEAGGSYGLHRLNLATGEIQDLGLENETMHYDTSPAFSPDGTRLAFARFDRRQRLNDVMVQRLGPGLVPIGPAEPVAPLEPSIYHSLHWSAAGDALWFADSHRLLEWVVNDEPRVAHTLGPRFSIATMAMLQRPQGVRAAVVVRQSGSEILAVPLDPRTHAAVGPAEIRVPAPAAIDYHPRVSPDGRWLAFVSDRSGAREIWIANRDGTRPRKLTDVGQLIVGFPRWSPDGRTIAFHSSAPDEERLIFTVDVESGRTKQLFNGCCPGGWSADGRSLYVTQLGPVNYVQRVDVDSGAREQLFEGETAMESADGRFLLYAKSREPGYFRRPLDAVSHQGEEVRLVDDYQPSLGGIAPVAEGFFYVGLTPEGAPRAIRFYDYALGAARDVAPVPADTAIGLSVSPDERELFYAAVADESETDVLLLEFADSGHAH